MDWVYTRERGPEWKQGWKELMLSSISAPPRPLMLVFAIVIFLLSLSEYNSYKEQMHDFTATIACSVNLFHSLESNHWKCMAVQLLVFSSSTGWAASEAGVGPWLVRVPLGCRCLSAAAACVGTIPVFVSIHVVSSGGI